MVDFVKGAYIQISSLILICLLQAVDVKNNRIQLKKIEDLGALLEEYLILDNRYTEHRFAFL